MLNVCFKYCNAIDIHMTPKKSIMISVRLPKKILEDINGQIEQGFVMNKADFVRQAICDKLRSVNSQTL